MLFPLLRLSMTLIDEGGLHVSETTRDNATRRSKAKQIRNCDLTACETEMGAESRHDIPRRRMPLGLGKERVYELQKGCGAGSIDHFAR